MSSILVSEFGAIAGVARGGWRLGDWPGSWFVTGLVQLTSKAQCRGAGWRMFGFKNQGDCVSFLATRGKNPPSGS